MSAAASSSGQASLCAEGLETMADRGPGGIGSNMTEEELGLVRARFFFPREFTLELVGSGDRVTSPPRGRIGVYVETLRAGLRFPLHGFVNELLATYRLVPAQLAPNSWRLIIGFLSLCLIHRIPTSVRLFRGCFMLKTNPADKEWLYFAVRGGQPLFRGIPSSIHGWKEKFFFLSSERTWGFNPEWDSPQLKANNRLPIFTETEEKELNILRSLKEKVHLPDLLSEEALMNVGLSSAQPEEIAGMVFSNDTLLARYNKRAAEAGGSRPWPRHKKSRPSSDASREERPHPEVADPSHQKKKGKEPSTGGTSDQAAREVLAPAPISARPAPSSHGGRAVVRLRRSGPERGSGLGVPSSSRPQRSSSSGAHPPSSSRAEPNPDKTPYRPEWLLFEDDRALENSCVAREVVRCALLPADRAQMEAGELDEFVEKTYCSAVRHLHEVNRLANAVQFYQDKSWESEQRIEAAEKRIKDAEAKAKEAEARVGVAESRLKEANERLQEEESEHALCRSALRAAEARNSDLMSELGGKKHENAVLRLKVEQMENRARKAEERARSAVEIFRRSEEYQNELAEEAVDGLIRGFEDFRTQVKRICPQFDFDYLRPRLSEEGFTLEEPEVEAEMADPGTIAEDASGVLPEAGSEVVLGAVLEVEPEAVPEVTPEAAPETAPEVVAEVAPEVAVEAVLEATAGAAPEAIAEAVSPEVVIDV